MSERDHTSVAANPEASAPGAPAPRVHRLEDYRPPEWLVERIELTVALGEEGTEVDSTLALRRNPDTPAGASREEPPPLELDGQELELLAIELDGAPLPPERYTVTDERLVISGLGERARVRTRARIHPERNTSLEGLYRSGAMYCTQCEAEGFRRITWFPDRPDVLARYRVRIEADEARYPVLLSNGNPVARGRLEGGRHYATWEDPFPKPSYLFALVAGDLHPVEDVFLTRSGREVALAIYVEAHNLERCAHAMTSLKRAMRWDEEVHGLEYDLERFMIVAVDHFNMGAMENKGLNIFNSRYVLADPATATDTDYEHIEGIIAHEYFHNWTGNRVTCRDWFQLSLKEGLTVFRDQQFSADMGSAPVKRINDVRVLRTAQFREDAGPMAHPVRPASYLEINNFYTVTVYNKGAEVIRMMHTLLGQEGFRRGMDLYFARHDGQAVTTEDFVRAMEDANGADFRQFRRWYTQAGTPEISFEERWLPGESTLELTLRQHTAPTADGSPKEPFHIPVAVGLLSREGRSLPVELAGERREEERRSSMELEVPTGAKGSPSASGEAEAEAEESTGIRFLEEEGEDAILVEEEEEEGEAGGEGAESASASAAHREGKRVGEEEEDKSKALGAGGEVGDLETARARIRELEARIKSLEDDLASAEQELALADNKYEALEAEYNKLHERLLRLSADFDNLRKRSAREKEDLKKYGAEAAMRDLLTVLDNFDLALSALKDAPPSVLEGIEMVYKQFLDILARHGVKRFNSKGEAFDYTRHEAFSLVETDELPPNFVYDEFQAGYTFHDRLLRPARVVVSKAPAAADEAPSEGSDSAQGDNTFEETAAVGRGERAAGAGETSESASDSASAALAGSEEGDAADASPLAGKTSEQRGVAASPEEKVAAAANPAATEGENSREKRREEEDSGDAIPVEVHHSS